jgi:NTP pyrophosphatase (non-canonical NTP hydrolase)
MTTSTKDPALDIERRIPRDQRQDMLASWAELAFGRDESTSIPQRGLRLLEEAIEAFQATGGDEAIAHKLVAFVFARPPGTIGQELGGVAVTTLLLAKAAGLSADEEECREIHRVLSKPLREFTERNANKNAAGFKIEGDSRD